MACEPQPVPEKEPTARELKLLLWHACNALLDAIGNRLAEGADFDDAAEPLRIHKGLLPTLKEAAERRQIEAEDVVKVIGML